MNDTPRTDTCTGFSESGLEVAPAFIMRVIERENNALRARVESASAIITELLANTVPIECKDSAEATSAAVAWLNNNTP